ncbi:hypothetical protein HPC37_01100 [Pasteurellaceae bacterium 20609_3]|uniref:hypothetical protein n=1 Tax=Spirabiliibacterium mucosae TaxID=28156 RepID=UPI001AAD8B86|nr:hypothetical protein [Spirabiliibacterium mucosae]MBE2897478.1 hypothetical protein [Spirabiliibacterium mucosae]
MDQEYKAYLIKKVEAGLKDIEENRTMTWEEAVNKARQAALEDENLKQKIA